MVTYDQCCVNYENWNDKSNRYKKEGPKEFIKNRINFNKYSGEQKTQTITYVLLIVGFIIFLFNNPIGEFIVGGVVGYHFYAEVIHYMRNLGTYRLYENKLRSISLITLFAIILLNSFPLLMGAVITAFFRNAFSHSNYA